MIVITTPTRDIGQQVLDKCLGQRQVRPCHRT